MDRQTVYPGAIPLETDLLNTNRNVLVGLSKIAAAVLGTSTLVNGLACTPTSPASLQVNVAPGEIYSLQNLDGTAYSSLAADTTHQILKQGLLMDAVTLNCPAPSTSGYSINYLIEATYQDVDGNAVVLPYYNASNPSQAYSGQNNNGTAQNTTRKGVCTVAVKAGVAATGTQQTPAADSGYVGLWVVTVAYGQTQITAANIVQATNAPFLPSGGIVPAIQNNAFNYALDTGTANTYQVSYNPPVTALTDGVMLSFRAKNTNTAGSTFSPNGLAAKPVYSQAHVALLSGEIAANGLVEVEWNSALNGWVLCENSGGIAHGMTPSQFDNTKKLATTEFVQRALGNYQGITNSLAPTAADSGKRIVATNTTVTLPSVGSLSIGSRFSVFAYGGGKVTVVASGSDTFSPGGGYTGLASISVPSGTECTFVSESNQWEVSGTGALNYAMSFGALLAGSGFQKLPSGLIIQWGVVGNANGSSDTQVLFPIAFPNACLHVSGSVGIGAPTQQASSAVIASATQSGFSFGNWVYTTRNTNGLYWFALGY